jgi:hypothetical protein
MKSELCECLEYHLKNRCEFHPDPWDCPDVILVKTKSQIGIPIRDGGRSSIGINFCPICGEKIKKH